MRVADQINVNLMERIITCRHRDLAAGVLVAHGDLDGPRIRDSRWDNLSIFPDVM